MSTMDKKSRQQRGKKSNQQAETKASQPIESEYRELFRKIDKDNDGFISGREITQLFRAAGFNPTDKEMKNTLSSLHSDKNENVTFEDFLNLMRSTEMSKDPQVQSKELIEAFKTFDKNDDGVIDYDEFKMIMSHGNDPVDAELESLWKSVDINGDGVLQYEEFVELWTKI